MKTTYIRLIFAASILSAVYSCKKGEVSKAERNAYATADSAAAVAPDSISSAASIRVKDKQFITTAHVNMEVKNVYEATISIEKSVQELGGFVTHSEMKSNIISEETYHTSDEEALLIKKYQTENGMQVKVPSGKLGELLTLVNDRKLFLNTRSIHAEDVTSDIKYAALESNRVKKNENNISRLKPGKDQVKLDNENAAESNIQQLNSMNVTDQLKYSTVDIYIKEPGVRVAAIPVINTESIDKQYRFDFAYSIKTAFEEGYYLIQKIIAGLIAIWPILLIAAVVTYFIRKRKTLKKHSAEMEI